MGGYVNYSKRIEILSKKWDSPTLQCTFDEMDTLLKILSQNTKIEVIQISDYIPEHLLAILDDVFQQRPDLTFRIYGFYSYKGLCDLSFLEKLPHIHHLSIDYIRHVENMKVLKKLSLKKLRLYIYDHQDYSIVKELSTNLTHFSIFYETKNKVHFDCEWLTRYPQLSHLYLGKVNKNIEYLAQLKKLKKLTLRGIKLKDLSFLKDTMISDLAIHWCSMNDLSSLSHNSQIHHLELWRILKLEDLSFISTLSHLQTLRLIDLANITTFPMIKNNDALHSIYLENMKNLENIDTMAQSKSLKKLQMIGIKKIETSALLPIFENPNIVNVDIRGAGNQKKAKAIEKLMLSYHKQKVN